MELVPGKRLVQMINLRTGQNKVEFLPDIATLCEVVDTITLVMGDLNTY